MQNPALNAAAAWPGVLGENKAPSSGASSERILFVQGNSGKVKFPVCDLEFLLPLGSL